MQRWLPVLVVFGILTAGWLFTPAVVDPYPLCLFKHITSYDCPGCGLTRSFLSLARGHVIDAFHFNPAGPLLYLFFIFYLYDLICRALNKSTKLPPLWLVKIYSVLLFIVLMGQWVLKLKNEIF